MDKSGRSQERQNSTKQRHLRDATGNRKSFYNHTDNKRLKKESEPAAGWGVGFSDSTPSKGWGIQCSLCLSQPPTPWYQWKTSIRRISTRRWDWIRDYLRQLKPEGCTEHEGLHSRALKKTGQCPSNTTLYCLWKLMEFGGDPWWQRKSNVVKKGQKNNTGKYRQVIFTLVLGKIMEQVILVHISVHMKEKRVSGNRKLMDLFRINHVWPSW